MLVLSRKKNESIVINNDITVTVVEIRGDKIRLGIVAPKEVPVHRQEVYNAIHGLAACADMAPSTVVVAKPVDALAEAEAQAEKMNVLSREVLLLGEVGGVSRLRVT